MEANPLSGVFSPGELMVCPPSLDATQYSRSRIELSSKGKTGKGPGRGSEPPAPLVTVGTGGHRRQEKETLVLG